MTIYYIIYFVNYTETHTHFMIGHKCKTGIACQVESVFFKMQY